MAMRQLEEALTAEVAEVAAPGEPAGETAASLSVPSGSRPQRPEQQLPSGPSPRSVWDRQWVYSQATDVDADKRT